VLSGHLDVVPALRDRWDTNPFELVEKDGNLYGRGACDMKGFVALAMNLLAESNGSTALPLMLILTAEEEVGALGAKALADAWPADELPPREMLIGEPTTLDVIAMHKGHLKVRIQVSGESAHSGTPLLGANAIERGMVIINALGELRDVLHKEHGPYAEAFAEAPFPALNIGRIHGGTAINVVPDSCTIELGVRPLPGQSSDDLYARIQSAIDRSSVSDHATLEVINDTPALDPRPDSRIVNTLNTLRGQSDLRGVSFASDGGVLQQAFDMSCALCGPGDMARAHRPNEYITIDELREGRRFLENLWTTWQERTT
jgi:acetylornithine deacetylase